MILRKYGIDLRSLAKTDLELVRQMRNSEYVRSRMLYKKEISKEEQLDWFDSLKTDRDFYFIIEQSMKPCGLINIKNVDYENQKSESGLFIWDQNILKSHIPVLASWLLSEAGYGILNGPGTEIRVLKSNAEAIRFNQKMGFSIIKENNDIVFMYQSKNSFSEATKASRTAYIRNNAEQQYLDIIFNSHSYDSFYRDTILFIAKKFNLMIEIPEKNHFRIKINF